MAQARQLPEARTFRDLLLAAVGTLVAIVCLTAALRPTPAAVGSNREIVARIRLATGALQVRPAETLGWQTVTRGDGVHEADAVYVPPGAEAQVEFLDGTVLELDERTLIVIDQGRDTGRSVTLRQGALSGRAAAVPLTFATTAGATTLKPRSAARVDLLDGGLDVNVTVGAATVAARGRTTEVVATARARVMEELVLLPAWPVTLKSPEPQHRLLFHGAPAALSFSWEGATKGARLQLARDRLFAFLDEDVAVESGAFELRAPKPGVTWWRLVDERGAPISEARRFSFVEDLAPANRLPRSSEVVLAPPGSKVEFAWTPLPGITRYLLEVSASQGFEPLMIRELVSGTQVKVSSSLPEGSWHWRVRAADDALGECLPSEATRFRVIHKAILDAPELLNPEIEVTPAREP